MDEPLNKKFKNLSSFQNPDLIEKAYLFAEKAHTGQKRLSGEDYIVHPLNVASFLADLKLDSSTIAAGLLHDVLEDTKISAPELRKEFGEDIAFLVEGVTKLRNLDKIANPALINKGEAGKEEETRRSGLESLKKMFFATAEDIRVILIKLADKYHNMETLKFMTGADQKRIATETLEIYAPIAERLGMGKLKGQLEDLAFPYVYPKEYSWLLKRVKEKYEDRLNYIDRVKPLIRKYLTDAEIPVIDLHSRAKHYYSLYQKLQKKGMDPERGREDSQRASASYGMELEKIHDLVAMRIIVPDIKSCYEALGIIHKHYKPLPGLIKDYIALPKPNGYQSLHTTIFCEKGRLVEIQIRTKDMHDYAENGIAAHWAYSESGKKKPVTANPKEVEWVAQLKKFLEDSKTGESFASLKIDFFKNRIFTFTPKGDVKDLPDGATPIDFAYSIHTDLGHATKGAKINGKIVPLDYGLRNGDVVEIIKGKEKKPSFDWLKIVRTAFARKTIASWLRESGDSRIAQIEEKIKKPKIKREKIKIRVKATRAGEPVIEGQQGLLYKIAKCCDPAPGQKIKGYMTLTKGVSIHTHQCSNIKNAPETRLVSVLWESKK